MKVIYALLAAGPFLMLIGTYLWLRREQFGRLPSAADYTRFRALENFDAASKTFKNPRSALRNIRFWRVLKDFVRGREIRVPSQPLPSVHPDIKAFLAKEGPPVKWLWLGHSTFYLNLEGILVLVDPVFSSASPFPFMGQRFEESLVELADLPRADVVVLSHDHYDHLDADAIRVLAKDSPIFVVPLGLGARLKTWGIKPAQIAELNWQQSIGHKIVKFTAVPAQHFSGRSFRDKNRTLWAGWMITTDSVRIFYSGDTGYSSHFKEIGAKYGPIDLAFLECGQYNEHWPYVHLKPEEVISAAKDLGAKAFSPLHWGMYRLALHDWFEPIENVTQRAAAEGLTIWHPKLGELMQFPGEAPQDAWWRQHPDFLKHHSSR